MDRREFYGVTDDQAEVLPNSKPSAKRQLGGPSTAPQAPPIQRWSGPRKEIVLRVASVGLASGSQCAPPSSVARIVPVWPTANPSSSFRKWTSKRLTRR